MNSLQHLVEVVNKSERQVEEVIKPSMRDIVGQLMIIVHCFLQLLFRQNELIYNDCSSLKKKLMQKAKNRRSNEFNSEEIEFLRDFDLLTTIEQQEADLYLSAKMNVGEALMKQNYVLKQDGTEYSIKCDIDEFKQFGPGIYLLFKLLKFLTLIFGVVSLVAVALIILLASGSVRYQSHINNQFTSGILKTTLYHLIQADFVSYLVMDFLITVFLSIALIFWCEKEKKFTIQCLQETTLASYFTVILKNLPQHYRQNILCSYLQQQFGQVSEIYTVRNFGDDLLHYKQMSQVVQHYKQQKALLKIDHDRNCDGLINMFFEFRNGHKKLKDQVRKSQHYQPCFAFIQFKKIQDRDKLLQYREKNGVKWCCFRGKAQVGTEHKKQYMNDDNNTMVINVNRRQRRYTNKFEFEGIKISECQMQPCGIIWQNLHLTKGSMMIRVSVMILMMVVLMVLSVFLIILLSVMQMSVINSKFKDFERDQIIKIHDNFAFLSYCVNLSLPEFYQQSDLCSQYKAQYFKYTFMSFLVPLSISLFKLILTEIMKILVTFRRQAYQVKKVQSQAWIIFIFYFAVTGIFQLFIYLGTSSHSLFDLFTPLIQILVNSDFNSQKVQLFPDYVPNWYATASPNILMIGIVSFNLSALGIILYCKIRTKIFRYYAMKQKIQIQMNSWLNGYSLEIQYVYAAILTIFYFTLLFGVAMPLLYISAFVSFGVLFWSYKYIFITFCQRPLTYNHSINKKMRKIMFGALILHCLFAPIFLKAPGIANYSPQSNSIFSRLATLWYYLLLMIVLIIYLIFQNQLRILFAIIKEKIKKIVLRNTQKQLEDQKWKQFKSARLATSLRRRNFSLPSMIRKRQNQLANESYSMHENHVYKNILKTLYTINNKQRARKSCLLNSNLRHLYSDNFKFMNDEDQGYRALVEVIKAVRKDYKKFSAQHDKCKNPYEKSKKKLYEIYQTTKQAQNRKYTLYYSDSLGSKQMPSVSNQNIDENPINYKQFIQNDEYLSGSKTKQLFLTTNLQKVIEQPQYLQASEQKSRYDQSRRTERFGENMQENQSNQQRPRRLKRLVKENKVQIPPISENRLNQRVV